MAVVIDNAKGNERRSRMTAILCLAAFLFTVSHRAFHYESHSITYFANLRSHKTPANHIESVANPNIVWLMSYPNSGTSYTMTLMQRVSNYAFATNYGDEVTAPNAFSVPISSDHPEGPYWTGMSGQLDYMRMLPPDYVMVKTHCGSRCVRCGPREYTETLEAFTDACRLSSGRVAPDRHRDFFLYSTDRVHKAIHLIRNPFHNIVARFHLDSRNRQDAADWWNNYPDNSVGFQQWCLELDAESVWEEHEMLGDELLQVMHMSPCHSEVFKYVQWHNLAFSMVDALEIPSLTVFYEDYGTHFNETVTELLDFLHLPARGEVREFTAPTHYDSYFSRDGRNQMRKLAKRLASKKTWESIEHYFE